MGSVPYGACSLWGLVSMGSAVMGSGLYGVCSMGSVLYGVCCYGVWFLWGQLLWGLLLWGLLLWGQLLWGLLLWGLVSVGSGFYGVSGAYGACCGAGGAALRALWVRRHAVPCGADEERRRGADGVLLLPPVQVRPTSGGWEP